MSLWRRIRPRLTDRTPAGIPSALLPSRLRSRLRSGPSDGAAVRLRAQRPGHGKGLRTPAITLEIGRSIASGRGFVLLLERGPRHVLLVFRGPFFGARLVANAALPAAEGDVAVSGDIAPFDDR